LGSARAGVAVSFEIGPPQDYAIVSLAGRASGPLDGIEVRGARPAGHHVLVPSADSRLAVVCSPALLRGLEPNELFTMIDR
jgi:hypothetical protein